MDHNKETRKLRIRRKCRVRKPLRGDADAPRLSVFRSHKQIYCQLIDDSSGVTLVSVSTRDKELRSSIKYGGNKESAALVGKRLAEKAVAVGIQRARFDRGAYKYHGRVAALADAAREAGLQF